MEKNGSKMWILVFAVLFALSFTTADVADARGGGGSSAGRSSGFRSTSSRSVTKSWGPSTTKSWSSDSKSTTKQWGSPKMDTVTQTANPNKNQASDWGSSKQSATRPTLSKADQTLYDKAKKQGTMFKNRDEAAKDFQAKHAKEYPSKFDKEPAKRPGYIPSSTQVDGHTYNITYNSRYGGYGYFDPFGRWMLYDAMRDMMMLSMLMGNHGYYYGPAPVYAGEAAYANGAAPVVVQPSSGVSFYYFTKAILLILMVGAFIVLMVWLVRKS